MTSFTIASKAAPGNPSHLRLIKTYIKNLENFEIVSVHSVHIMQCNEWNRQVSNGRKSKLGSLPGSYLAERFFSDFCRERYLDKSIQNPCHQPWTIKINQIYSNITNHEQSPHQPWRDTFNFEIPPVSIADVLSECPVYLLHQGGQPEQMSRLPGSILQQLHPAWTTRSKRPGRRSASSRTCQRYQNDSKCLDDMNHWKNSCKFHETSWAKRRLP